MSSDEETLYPELARRIEVHRTAGAVPTDSETLGSGPARVTVRRRGAYLTALDLVPADADAAETAAAVPVLYAGPDLSVAKLDGSHAMSPVGPWDGIGGQHGVARWADYAVDDRSEPAHAARADAGEPALTLRADTADHPVGILRSVRLAPSTLHLETRLVSSAPADVGTSIGEHLYFRLPGAARDPEGTGAGITIDGAGIDEIVGREGSERAMMSGDSRFWPGFADRGRIVVGFPGGRRIALSCSVDGAGRLGMLLWHRPGTDSVCVEPTVGFDGSAADGLVLPAGGTVALDTTIELLSA